MRTPFLIPIFLLFVSLRVESARLLPHGREDRDSVRVRTSKGLLEGRSVRVGFKKCHVFRKIPFAQPPLGPLRFRKPQPVHKWTGTWNATEYGPACMANLTRSDHAVAMSEDCLYLNVFTSDHCMRHNKSCPILVLIHGGAFTFGNAVQYNDTQILEKYARHDIVFVVPAYRVGMFGFADFGADSEEAPYNVGLHDIIAALNWTRREIGAFGGDPDRVTLFGYSSGATAVQYLMVSPALRDERLFSRVMLSSGLPVMTAHFNRDFTKRFVEFAGCAIEPSTRLPLALDAQLSCLRQRSAQNLTDALGLLKRAWPSWSHIGAQSDSHLLPARSYEVLAERRKSVPLLFVTSKDEIGDLWEGNRTIEHLCREFLRVFDYWQNASVRECVRRYSRYGNATQQSYFLVRDLYHAMAVRECQLNAGTAGGEDERGSHGHRSRPAGFAVADGGDNMGNRGTGPGPVVNGTNSSSHHWPWNWHHSGIDGFNKTGWHPGIDGLNKTGWHPGIDGFNRTGWHPDIDGFNRTGWHPGIDGYNKTGWHPGIDGFNNTNWHPGIDGFNKTGWHPGIDGYNRTNWNPNVDGYNRTNWQPGIDGFNKTGWNPSVDNYNRTGWNPGVDSGPNSDNNTGWHPGVDSGRNATNLPWDIDSGNWTRGHGGNEANSTSWDRPADAPWSPFDYTGQEHEHGRAARSDGPDCYVGIFAQPNHSVHAEDMIYMIGQHVRRMREFTVNDKLMDAFYPNLVRNFVRGEAPAENWQPTNRYGENYFLLGFRVDATNYTAQEWPTLVENATYDEETTHFFLDYLAVVERNASQFNRRDWNEGGADTKDRSKIWDWWRGGERPQSRARGASFIGLPSSVVDGNDNNNLSAEEELLHAREIGDYQRLYGLTSLWTVSLLTILLIVVGVMFYTKRRDRDTDSEEPLYPEINEKTRLLG